MSSYSIRILQTHWKLRAPRVSPYHSVVMLLTAACSDSRPPSSLTHSRSARPAWCRRAIEASTRRDIGRLSATPTVECKTVNLDARAPQCPAHTMPALWHLVRVPLAGALSYEPHLAVAGRPLTRHGVGQLGDAHGRARDREPRPPRGDGPASGREVRFVLQDRDRCVSVRTL